jgi:ankyrin repeat protein
MAKYQENMVGFLKHACNPTLTKSYNGDTPLHKACIDGNENMLQLLLQKGADVSIKNNEAKHPFDWQRIKVGCTVLLSCNIMRRWNSSLILVVQKC